MSHCAAYSNLGLSVPLCSLNTVFLMIGKQSELINILNLLFKGSVHQNHIDAPLIFKSVAVKKIIGEIIRFNAALECTVN